MKILVLANQKGGVGKTTLSGHLSVTATQQGHGPVALIDTDPQGSLAAWWNEREAEEPFFASVAIESLSDHLKALAKTGVQLVVIDTPPAVTSLITAVIQFADLVLIPIRPGPHDLRAVGATVDIVDGAKKKMIFVVNGAKKRARITADAAVALSQHGKVAPVIVGDRVDFATSMIDGRTAQEIDHTSESADEIRRLWSYVAEQLVKK